MAVTITVNGTTYSIPETGATGWGSEVTNLLSTLGDGFLQKYTGSAPGTTIDFTLGADVDFGASHGFVINSLTSQTTGAAEDGFLRLADGDTISWKYSGTEYDLTVTNGVLTYNGQDITTASNAQTLLNKILNTCTIDADQNTLTNVRDANVASDADIAQSKISGLVTALAGKEPTVTKGSLTSPTSGVTVVGGSGAVIGAGTAISIATASAIQNGLLSATDYARFDSAAPQDLSNVMSGTAGINVSANTDTILSDTPITITADTASGSQPGLLSSADWTKFNNKQSLISQEVFVAKAGGAFTSVQSAIDSITDASSTKPYTVVIHPGLYVENVVIKDWVFLRGVDVKSCVIVGKVTGTLSGGAQGGMDTLTVYGAPNTAANYKAVEISGDSTLANLVVTIQPGSGFNGDIVGVELSGSTIMYAGLIGVNLIATAGTIGDFCGFEVGGSSALSIYESAVTVNCSLASGTYQAYCLSNTGDSGARMLLAYMQFYNPAFAGTVVGFNCTTVATSSTNIRICQSCAAVIKGAGSGTAYGTRLDTGAAGSFRHDGLSLHIDGFTNEYSSYTGAGDSQKLWIVSQNKAFDTASTGLTVATPQDQNLSGFVRWGGSGSYWSFDASTGQFTVLRGGAGVIKSTPVTWVANQSVTLSSLATHYVYVDTMGVVKSTTSAAGLFDNAIVLFEAWRDGTASLVTKENHPYEFTTAVSEEWHQTFGSLVTGAGANLTQLGVAANRQLAIVGDDILIDHGLNTTITSAPATAATFQAFYTNGSGKMVQDGSSFTAFPSRWSNAGTPQNGANNDRVVYRIGVLKDGLNSSSPTFVASMHTAVYGNNASALAAISNGQIAAFPAELRGLEVVQLGFLVIQSNGAGAGSIISGGVVVSKQAFAAALIGGSSSNQASLITTNVTNFTTSGDVTSVLSAADTTAQAAFDTLARGAVPRYVADIAWTGSAGAYSVSISAAAHTRGLYPKVECYSLVSGETTVYEKANINYTVDWATGNVVVYSTENFTGKVVII